VRRINRILHCAGVQSLSISHRAEIRYFNIPHLAIPFLFGCFVALTISLAPAYAENDPLLFM